MEQIKTDENTAGGIGFFPPALSEGAIHIWCADVFRLNGSADRLTASLSENERERACRLKSGRVRDMFLFSRGILRHLISVYTGVNPAEVEIFYSASGKPYIKNQNIDLRFNLSHSSNIALYAFAEAHDIGIDVEFKRDIENLESLAASTLSGTELKNFASVCETDRGEEFFRYWTHKESYIKATGEGISMDLHDIEFIPNMDGGLELNLRHDTGQNQDWSFFEIFPEKNYTAALAAPERGWRIYFYRWNEIFQ